MISILLFICFGERSLITKWINQVLPYMQPNSTFLFQIILTNKFQFRCVKKVIIFRNVMSGIMMTVFVRLPQPYFVFLGITFYIIHQVTPERPGCRDVALFDRGGEYRSAATSGPVCTQQLSLLMIDWFNWFIVLNATFSNISQPVLVVEEAGIPGENQHPWESNW